MVPFSLGNADAKYIGRKECSLSLQLAGSSDTVYDKGAVRRVKWNFGNCVVAGGKINILQGKLWCMWEGSASRGTEVA